MKFRFIIFLWIFLQGFSGMCQVEFITISGKIIDEDSGEPLPFASVGMENSSLGTISNAQGEFDFHLPATLSNRNMVIKMLGFEEFRKPFNSFSQSEINTINMQKSTTMLEEVVIVDSLSGGDILRIALARIEQNYPMTEYSMQGFYRDVKKVNGEYISLLEAALEIYDKDYSVPRNPLKLRERVGLKEVRKSLNYEFAYRKYFDQYNLLEELLLENNVKYRSFTTEPVFYENIKREKNSNIGSSTVYELQLTADMGYKLTLYVDKEDYGIHKLVFQNGDGNTPLEELNRSGKRVENIMKLEKNIEFSKFDNTYYLRYIRVKTDFRWINLNNDSIEAETELFQELMINEVNNNDPSWVSSSDKMKRYGLQYQDLPYNNKFWENYNVIKDTPLNAEIIHDLEKYGDLNSQFEKY